MYISDVFIVLQNCVYKSLNVYLAIVFRQYTKSIYVRL